jgi:succinate-acetate transporter protein
MSHPRFFHDCLFIVLGIAFLLIAVVAIPRGKASRVVGIIVGLLNVFVAIMDILHTPGMH